jgi:putative membrane protein
MFLVKKSMWLQLAIDLRSSVIYAIWRRVLVTMLFALLITIAYQQGYSVNQPILAGLIPGVVLGLLLVFRTNTAYDRFWEGCKLWYDSINASRILCRNIWTIVLVKTPEDVSRKIFHLRLVGILIVTIKLHLRNENLDNKLAKFMTEEQYLELKEVNNKPVRIMNWFADYFSEIYHLQKIISYRLFVELNRFLDQISMIFSGCERILNTPLPRPYSIHLKHLLLLYCFALPFQFVKELHWFIIPVVGIISFALLGIEDIGVEIENPFGYDRNDLPLEQFSQQFQAEIETEWVNFEISKSKYL